MAWYDYIPSVYVGKKLFGTSSPDPKLQNNLQGDADRQRALGDKFLAALPTAGTASAPTMSAATAAPAAQANTPIVGATNVRPVQQVRAAQTTPATRVADVAVGPAAQANGVQLAPAVQQGRTSVAPAATVDPNGFSLGPAQVAGAGQTGPAAVSEASKVKTDRSDQFRTRQLGLADNLTDVIAGKGPSVAAEQLRETTDKNIANARGNAVAAARGGNTALALRTLARTQGDVNQQAAGQSALLRAQEIATARGQLGGVLDNGRGQDIGIETTDANNATQVSLANAAEKNKLAITNAQLGTEANLKSAEMLNAQKAEEAKLRLAAAQGNRDAINALAQQQATLDASQSANNANIVNSRDLAQAQIDAARNEANAGRQQQVTLTAADIAAAKARQDATAQNAVDEANAQRLQAAATTNAGNDTTLATTQAGIDSTRNVQGAQIAADINKVNANAINTVNDANANREQAARTTNVNAAVQTRGQNIDEVSGLRKDTIAANSGATAADSAALDSATKASDSENKQKGQYLQTAGQLAGTLSDKNEKKGVHEEPDRNMRSFLDAIDPAAWDTYKDPEAAHATPGPHHGVIAQDVAKGGPIGRAMVRETPAGLTIDIPQAVGSFLGALKFLDKRIQRMERRA